MKILICPDKFKGSLTAEQVCHALQSGIEKQSDHIHISNHPMADGGDGSIAILKNLLNLKEFSLTVNDPLGKEIKSYFYHDGTTAFIELAKASGLALLDPADRNPLYTSTIGTGQMMKAAIKHGFKKICLFIGGSATNDGGIGIAQCLGFEFLDKDGFSLPPIGNSLSKIHTIRNQSTIDFCDIQIDLLCDVDNPMTGPSGATHAYAAQKGADENAIVELERGMLNYCQVLQDVSQKDISNRPGMGAAGAVSASLVSLMNAELKNGFDMISELTGLKAAIADADVVITGEGKVDKTSFQGKVVGKIAELCHAQSKPCGIICGAMDQTEGLALDLLFVKSIMSKAHDVNDAMMNAEDYLVSIGEELASQHMQK